MKRLMIVGLLLIGGGVSTQDWSQVYKKVAEENMVLVEGDDNFCSSVMVGTERFLTALHCLQNGSSGLVALDNWGKKHEMEPLKKSRKLDLLLLKGTVENRKSIKLAEKNPPIGSPILVIGWVSPTAPPAITSSHVMLTPFDELPRLTIDMTLQHGMSGGPSVNLKGELVGINVSATRDRGFLVPIEDVREFLGEK